jgi:integrase
MDFALYCKKNFNKTVLEVKALEIVQYFEVIDMRKKKDSVEITKSTKTHYRDYLRAYYKYIKGVKKDFEQVKFKIPIPDAKSWDFGGKETDLEDLESEGHLLTMDAIRQVLFYFFYRKYSDYDRKPSRTFIIVCLIILTGARIREIVQVELKNFDLKHRWFVTEVKSRKVAKRDGMYFFPEFFKPELEHYLQLLTQGFPNATCLFENKPGKHVSVRAVQGQLKKARDKLGLEALTNPHRFRDFLNTKRLEAGCDQSLRKFLLNQKAGDVNPDNYLKKYKNRVYLRGIYDKYNPFTEEILPEKPRL